MAEPSPRSPGEPTYVEDDYVENDYQAYEGNVVVLGPGDVGYSVPIDAVNDDGLDLVGGLRLADVMSNYTVVNDPPFRPPRLTPAVPWCCRQGRRGQRQECP